MRGNLVDAQQQKAHLGGQRATLARLVNTPERVGLSDGNVVGAKERVDPR